jgi:hypothetical protein
MPFSSRWALVIVAAQHAAQISRLGGSEIGEEGLGNPTGSLDKLVELGLGRRLRLALRARHDYRGCCCCPPAGRGLLRREGKAEPQRRCCPCPCR